MSLLKTAGSLSTSLLLTPRPSFWRQHSVALLLPQSKNLLTEKNRLRTHSYWYNPLKRSNHPRDSLKAASMLFSGLICQESNAWIEQLADCLIRKQERSITSMMSSLPQTRLLSANDWFPWTKTKISRQLSSIDGCRLIKDLPLSITGSLNSVIANQTEVSSITLMHQKIRLKCLRKSRKLSRPFC